METPGFKPGFFATLFDFSFSEFVTTKIIKILYGLALAVISVIFLSLFIALLWSGGFRILLALIVVPLMFLLSVIGARVWLELVIVIFRIAENTGEMAKQVQKPAAPAEKQA